MILYKSKSIYIGKSNIHGWGVFTDDFINKDELIEECNVIKFTSFDSCVNSISSHLFDYVLDDERIFYLPVGFCVTINSSVNPNVRFDFDMSSNIARIFSIKDINPGDEILLSYGFK